METEELAVCTLSAWTMWIQPCITESFSVPEALGTKALCTNGIK